MHSIRGNQTIIHLNHKGIQTLKVLTQLLEMKEDGLSGIPSDAIHEESDMVVLQNGC